MPKILFITTSFENGAIPNILGDLAPHWVAAGWSLEALTLEALPEGHASVARWKSLGLPLEGLGLSASTTWGALGPLRRAIKRIGPDLIHTHLGRADIYTPWAKGRVPQVSTFHSVRRNSGRATQWGWRLSDGRVAHRTGVSQACLDSFYSNGFLRSPHSVIYNPVSPERLVAHRTRQQVLDQLGWEDSAELLLAVGRLVPVKGHVELIQGFSQLARSRPHLRLVIAGEGPLEADLKALVRSLDLASRIVLVGATSAVADLYHAADLLVFPSHWEGLGLVPLEALVCGCPVASARLPAVEEFLTEGETGRFFDVGDVGAMASTIQQMLDDPTASRAMAAKGGLMVRERFSPAKIAAQYADLYREVLLG